MNTKQHNLNTVEHAAGVSGLFGTHGRQRRADQTIADAGLAALLGAGKTSQPDDRYVVALVMGLTAVGLGTMGLLAQTPGNAYLS